MDSRNKTVENTPAKDRIVFVGGIPISTTLQHLRTYLSTFDKVEKIQMPRHKDTGELKGYAKAVLATKEGVQRIITHPLHTIGGLKVGVMQWTDQRSYLKMKDEEGERKVHVRITEYMKEKDLLRYFQRYGKVEDISIRTYPGTNISRNFCYITFESPEAARAVIYDSPHFIKNEKVHCELSIRPIKKSKGEGTGSTNTMKGRTKKTANLKYPKSKQDPNSSLGHSQTNFHQGWHPYPLESDLLSPHEGILTEGIEAGDKDLLFSKDKQQRLRIKISSHTGCKQEIGCFDPTEGIAAIHLIPAYSPEGSETKKVNFARQGPHEDLIQSFVKPTSSKYGISNRMLVSRNHFIAGNLMYKVRLNS